MSRNTTERAFSARGIFRSRCLPPRAYGLKPLNFFYVTLEHLKTIIRHALAEISSKYVPQIVRKLHSFSKPQMTIPVLVVSELTEKTNPKTLFIKNASLFLSKPTDPESRINKY